MSTKANESVIDWLRSAVFTAITWGLIWMFAAQIFRTPWILAVLIAATAIYWAWKVFLRFGARRKRDDLMIVLQEKEEIARHEQGGSPEFPFVVDTPAVIDLRAQSRRCPICAGSLRFEEQTVDRYQGQLLRCTHLVCLSCHTPRRFWYTIAKRLPN